MVDSPRLPIAVAALLLTAATPVSPRLQAGAWEFTNVPVSASLNGRALDDLPYTPPTEPQRTCLSTADAADPARWFARDSGSDCRFTRRDLSGGHVFIVATCPAHDAGHRPGTLRLVGQWTPSSYKLRFSTETDGENGRMGFAGTMMGRRVGNCPG